MVTDQGGIRVLAPGLGEGAGVAAYRTDGTQSLDVFRPVVGALVVSDCGSELEQEAFEAGFSASSSPGACSDDAYKLLNFKWYERYRWRFSGDSTPSEISREDAREGIRDGVNAIPASHNNCEMADNVSAEAAYDGSTSKRATRCTTGAVDGTNVVDFGDLSKKALAVACWYYVEHAGPDAATEVDVRFNKADHPWTRTDGGPGCTNKYGVRPVMTHEAGHVFGLDHVREHTHGNLTMSRKSEGTCQESEYTLGRGDVLGLRERY